MFILPNYKQIDYEAVIDAMLDLIKDHAYWLDVETGACLLEASLIKYIGKTNLEIGNNSRYFFIPKISDFERDMMRLGFNSEIVESENFEMAEKLARAMESSAPHKSFIKVLDNAGEGWLAGWKSWENDGAFEEMKKWFAKLPFKIREEMDHFDGCPICQAMKEGRTSPKELKDAFREVNFKSVVDDIYEDSNG